MESETTEKPQARADSPRAEASRANGAKSHGPTSTTGRLNSRRNALTHGLTAKLLTLDCEADDNFTEILAAIDAQLQPANELEEQLVETIAFNRWRTLRTWSQEKAVLNTAIADARRADATNQGARDPDARPLRHAECAGIALRNLSDQSRVLALIDRNENRYQRFYHRALREFFALRDREQKAKCKAENDKTNPASPSKQSPPEKTNPANPASSDLMNGWRPSETLEARIAAFREREHAPKQSEIPLPPDSAMVPPDSAIAVPEDQGQWSLSPQCGLEDQGQWSLSPEPRQAENKKTANEPTMLLKTNHRLENLNPSRTHFEPN